MRVLRCIAIDDEPLALSIITGYIERDPRLQLVAKFTNSVAAAEYIERHDVELLFVDIEMPDMTGFQLIERLTNTPMVIFTTAYDSYAVEGFRVNAIDYLLKPIDLPDFERAVERALQRTAAERGERVESGERVEANSDFLYIKSGHTILRINFSDIQYIQGMSEYIKIYTCNSKPVMTLLSLKVIESKLPSSHFMRVHKSYIVNLDCVNAICRNEIIYEDGKVIPISAQYRESFNEFIKRNFPL